MTNGTTDVFSSHGLSYRPSLPPPAPAPDSLQPCSDFIAEFHPSCTQQNHAQRLLRRDIQIRACHERTANAIEAERTGVGGACRPSAGSGIRPPSRADANVKR